MMRQGKAEWEAWQTFVQEWNRLNIPDINDPLYNPLVNALRLWGEELVALRLIQEGTVRGTALVEARQAYERAVREARRPNAPVNVNKERVE